MWSKLSSFEYTIVSETRLCLIIEYLHPTRAGETDFRMDNVAGSWFILVRVITSIAEIVVKLMMYYSSYVSFAICFTFYSVNGQEMFYYSSGGHCDQVNVWAVVGVWSPPHVWRYQPCVTATKNPRPAKQLLRYALKITPVRYSSINIRSKSSQS